jgi:hypothetical protein
VVVVSLGGTYLDSLWCLDTLGMLPQCAAVQSPAAYKGPHAGMGSMGTGVVQGNVHHADAAPHEFTRSFGSGMSAG